MGELFLKIVNMSIAASWLILAIVLLRLALKKAPKWITCVLWALVAVRLICPFSFESTLSLVPDRELAPEQIHLEPSIHAAPVFSPGDVQVSPGNGDSQSLPAPAGHEVDTPAILGTIWLAGALALGVYALVSYWRIHRKVRPSLHLRDNLWLCDDIATPFILGILRPRIYIPSGTEEGSLKHIIAHETAHLKRRDHWWKPLGYLVLAVHWFNPLVWVAYILLCRDIELACDEKVIRDLGKAESIAYSETLLSCSLSRRTILVCPLAFGEVGVKERVKRVLNYKKPAFWVIVAAVVSCVVLAVCFLTSPADVSLAKRLSLPQASSVTSIEVKGANGTLLYDDPQELKSILQAMETVTVSKNSRSHTPGEAVPTHCTVTITGGDTAVTLHISDTRTAVWTDAGKTQASLYSVTDMKALEPWLMPPACTLWFDYITDPHMDRTNPAEIQLDAFPGVTFRSDFSKIEAISGSETTQIAMGMPIWSCFFSDLNRDGTPELCATIATGSGIVDTSVQVYDYANGKSYALSAREHYDYELSAENGALVARKYTYPVSQNPVPVAVGTLQITDGQLVFQSQTHVPDTTDLDEAVSAAIVQHVTPAVPDGYIHVESHKTLLTGSPSGGDPNTISVYAVALHECFSPDADPSQPLEAVSRDCSPFIFTFRHSDTGEYALTEVCGPSTTGDFTEEIRTHFSQRFPKNIEDSQSYVDTLKEENQQKAQVLLRQQGDFAALANRLLASICSPSENSSPEAHIREHRDAYYQLYDMGDATLRYCFGRFLRGNETGLQGHIMARVCQQILTDRGETEPMLFQFETGQDWFHLFYTTARANAAQHSPEEMRAHYPCAQLLLEMAAQENDPALLFNGKTARRYRFTGTEPMESASVVLYEDGKFDFVFSPLSSYLGHGHYTPDGSRLTLYTIDGAFTYVFDVKEDTLVFDADASSDMVWFSGLVDGSVLRESE